MPGNKSKKSRGYGPKKGKKMPSSTKNTTKSKDVENKRRRRG